MNERMSMSSGEQPTTHDNHAMQLWMAGCAVALLLLAWPYPAQECVCVELMMPSSCGYSCSLSSAGMV